MRKRIFVLFGVLVILTIGFASGYTAGAQPVKNTSAGAVSDALKLRAEQLKLRAANLQIALLQLDKEKAAIEVEARAVGAELRKALGATPEDDIDLVHYVIVKRQAEKTPPKS